MSRALLPAAVLVLPGAPVQAQTAQTAHTVPANSPLIPKNSSDQPLFTTGQSFRLLFRTTRYSTATSPDIETYNSFVQAAAAARADFASFSGGFRALISTAKVDARNNTATIGAGVPIYWINGRKVADNYADFYDGTWDFPTRSAEL